MRVAGVIWTASLRDETCATGQGRPPAEAVSLRVENSCVAIRDVGWRVVERQELCRSSRCGWAQLAARGLANVSVGRICHGRLVTHFPERARTVFWDEAGGGRSRGRGRVNAPQPMPRTEGAPRSVAGAIPSVHPPRMSARKRIRTGGALAAMARLANRKTSGRQMPARHFTASLRCSHSGARGCAVWTGIR